MTNLEDSWLDRLWLVNTALYRASLLGFLLTLTAVPGLFLREQIYAIHNEIIPMQRETYNAMFFGGYVLLKTMVITFLFLPALGLHWTIAKRRGPQKQWPQP